MSEKETLTQQELLAYRDDLNSALDDFDGEDGRKLLDHIDVLTAELALLLEERQLMLSFLQSHEWSGNVSERACPVCKNKPGVWMIHTETCGLAEWLRKLEMKL